MTNFFNYRIDSNLDNRITIVDALILIQYLLGNETLSDEQIKVADINEDNNIDIIDIVLLKNLILIQ